MPKIEEATQYTLGHGTEHARSIPLPAELGKSYDGIFGALDALFKVIVQQTAGRPGSRAEGIILQGIWLVWCYAAHDLDKLRTRLDDEVHMLLQQVDDLNQRLAALEGGVPS